jgi:hypothetical protein
MGWSTRGLEHQQGADGALLFHSPSGKTLERLPLPEPVEDILLWMREWFDERDLDLGPQVNEPLWDGTRPDYDWAISCLAHGR